MSATDDRISAAVLTSAKLPPLLARSTRAALNGVWLGVLSDARLDALDERYYDEDPLYVTETWNSRGLFDWERTVIDAHFAPRSRIAVTACGGGREVLALLEAGYDARGWESHPALATWGADFLAGRGHPGRVEPAGRDRFPAGVSADGVLVGWGAYSLIHGRERRLAFLRSARAALAPGAPVLASFFDVEHEGRELRTTRALGAALRRLRGRSAPELGDVLAPNLVHVFTRERFGAEARAAGFETAEYRVVGEADGATRYACALLRAAP